MARGQQVTKGGASIGGTGAPKRSEKLEAGVARNPVRASGKYADRRKTCLQLTGRLHAGPEIK